MFPFQFWERWSLKGLIFWKIWTSNITLSLSYCGTVMAVERKCPSSLCNDVVLGSALTIAAFALVVVVIGYVWWDRFLLTFFKFPIFLYTFVLRLRFGFRTGAYRGYMAPGARSKFGAPVFEPEVFRKQMYCIETSICDMIWRPHSDSRPGELRPSCPPRYAH